MREQLSKKTRFSVFKRDAFTCQYCGRTPPQVTLEVDHIHPVSKGGKNGIDNLITACFDCNRGKSGDLLTNMPQTIAHKAEILIEREAQVKALNKLLKQKRQREDVFIDDLEAIFIDGYPGYCFDRQFRESIRHNFMTHLDSEELINAMFKACSQGRPPQDATKYFCGICWRIRREKPGSTMQYK